MKKPKMSLRFEGLKEIAYELDAFPGALKEAISESLEASSSKVGEKLDTRMVKHEKPGRHKNIHGKIVGNYGTGLTRKSIYHDAKTTWQHDLAEQKVGFNISKGGIASVFLMYGTPKHYQPKMKRTHPGMNRDKVLYNAINNAMKNREIKAMNREIFEKVLARVGGHWDGRTFD